MKSKSSLILSTIGIVVIVLVVAYLSMLFTVSRVDRGQRRLLLTDARQAALLVPVADIRSLAGSEADLSNPVYQQLKNRLIAFRDTNPDIRFAYVMGYRPELRTQFFYVDSESTDSPDYSAPGDLYVNTREQDIRSYLAGEPYTDGPYRDSWGEWVSAYMPIKNEQGAVIAIVGLDVATGVWEDQINFVRSTIAIIAILLSIVIIFINRAAYRRLDSINDLSSKNRLLEAQRGTLKRMQQLAQMGTFIIYFPEAGIAIDEQFLPLFGDARMEKNRFRSFVHVDDQEKFEAMLKEITISSIVYAWVDIRIGTAEAGFRKYHIYGNIERHAGGAPERFDGVIQDITDITQTS